MRRSNGKQLTLFGDPPTEKVVNVASVPHRSPFRYPGGKTWLVPRIRQWIRSLPRKPKLLIEPFAGGGIIGLTVAFENLANEVVLIEIDEQVAAVWMTILDGDADWLARRILDFDLTIENVKSTLAEETLLNKEIAFQTVLKNRTFHGGILASGSSLIKQGENGKGIGSRWYPETLARRIRAIAEIRDRIRFTQGDGIKIIREYAENEEAVFFIDPPYSAGGPSGKRAGKRLYAHHDLDHEELFFVVENIAGPFLMTYDDSDDVVNLARKHGFEISRVPMKNTHHAKQYELVIGRNVDWLR
ncbi:MAG: DNA adenine methylase [Planctomycetes bacterium]|nr:DNA adenine methylase [Planctomycetota bacterium]